jgi:tetrachlorobenzoquinone reductase
MNTLEVFVKSMSLEATGVLSIELRPVKSELPSFSTGGHIDLYLPSGEVRSYSLINPQHETHRYLIAVNRDRSSRGGSLFIHDRLRPGDRLRIALPRNNFPLHESSAHSVLIAGGIGITPIWAMIQRLVQLGNSWELHYACRNRDCAAFLPSISAAASSAGARVSVSFDEESGGALLDLGRIVSAAPARSHFYCCGPAGMLRAYQEVTAGLEPDTVHAEYFTPPVAPARTTDSFTVVLARSGRSLTVEAGSSILETLLQNGVKANYSCTQGVCGTCATVVIEGEPEHRDWVLSDQEKARGKSMMICCSGSKTDRLVLDL